MHSYQYVLFVFICVEDVLGGFFLPGQIMLVIIGFLDHSRHLSSGMIIFCGLAHFTL